MGRTGLVQRPEHVDLADIVYQGEPRTRPLYIHFRFGAYRASVHVFLYTDIGKHRLDNTHPSVGGKCVTLDE
jgi:hypothetical protein